MFAPELPAPRSTPWAGSALAPGDQPGRGHAGLARFQQQRQGQAERELCPRADGAVQPGRRPLHREGRPRGRPAFTGWRTDGEGFAFDARLHDSGPKTVLGQTGAWDGGDVVRIVLEQPAAARFLVRKLYHFLVSEKAVPPDSLLEPLCESFRKSDYDIAGLVRTILASRHFYSDHAFRQRVKGPVEYVLGAVQAVYRRYRRGGGRVPVVAAAGAGGPAGRDGAGPVRAAQRQGLAGRAVLAEYLDGAGAR